MKRSACGLLVFVLSVAASLPPARAEGLLGRAGSFSIRYPNADTLFAGPVSFVVGDGQEGRLVGGNVTWLLDVDDSLVTLRFNDSGCCTDVVTFSGPVVRFTDPDFPRILGVEIVRNTIAAFAPERVSFTPDSLLVDVSKSVDLGGNRELVLRLVATPAPVPDVPAPVLWPGFALAAAIARRLRRLRSRSAPSVMLEP